MTSAYCVTGYYCPTGSSSETQIICPIGKKCPAGSPEPQDCDPGTYSFAQGQVNCTQCPAGWLLHLLDLC